MLTQILRRVLLTATVMLLALQAYAVDGFVITVHFELPAGQFGNIHDSSYPGKLMRYDIKNDQLVGSKMLFEGNGVGVACISPFGDRIAFTQPNGMLSVISVDGGPVTDVVSFIGEEKPKQGETPSTGLQWPASEGGQWIYYNDGRNGGNNNNLRRVNVNTKKDELVAHFNRSTAGSFALTMDATPHSGKYIKRTDNYAIVIYDLASGDGDLYSCPRTFGCGESVSPDGTLFTANSGDHVAVTLTDMKGQGQGGFRVSEWDGNPTQGIAVREKLEWAWQSFRWSVNAVNWISVTQGKLNMPSNTYSTLFEDAVIYDWVNKQQVNATKNPEGKFDRAQGFWMTGAKEGYLGYFPGEAPLTVEIADPRLTGNWQWDFGDGAKGATAKHAYTKAGTYTITATQGDKVFKGQVMVAAQQAPTATIVYVNPKAILVDFSEPVKGEAAQVVVGSGAKVESVKLNETGRRMTILLTDPMKARDTISIQGVTDLAQAPNKLAVKPVSVVAPAWPSNRTDLYYLWEDSKHMNAVYYDSTKTIRELRLGRSSGIDRYGRMRTTTGPYSTGFFSQSNAQADFGDLIKADAFTLELTLQTDDLTQKKGAQFPARIVNCSAWHDGDWEFMLGQQENKLLFSIRTTDNFLTLDGKPTKNDLHGRAPIYQIATLTDTNQHHVIVSYVPGKLVAYMDGKKVFETVEVTGSISVFGYGEMVFGGHHNGGRYNWGGMLEGVAIYKRFIDTDEALANYKAYQEKLKSRVILPQVEMDVTLTGVSEVPDPKKIAPYNEALVLNEYTITKITKTGADWKIKLIPGQKIYVAQWGVLESQKTNLAQAKVGETRHLVLENFEKHPDKLEQTMVINTLEEDPDVIILYEPRQ